MAVTSDLLKFYIQGDPTGMIGLNPNDSEFSKFLYGDVAGKQKLKSDINNLNNRLDSLSNELINTNIDDPKYKILEKERKDLLDQIDQKTIELELSLKKQKEEYKSALNKTYSSYLQGLAGQDVTDLTGKMLTGKEVAMKKGLMDKDYLNAIREQIGQREQGALATGLKLAKQQQLKGGTGDIGSVLAQSEAIRRGGSQELTGAVKGETESAYQKGLAERQAAMGLETQKYGMKRADLQEATAQERQDLYGINDRQAQALMNKVSLNASDRQFLQNKIAQQIDLLGRKINLTNSQINKAQQDLENMPNGFFQEALKFGSQLVGAYIGSKIGQPQLGAQVGTALSSSFNKTADHMSSETTAGSIAQRSQTGVPYNIYNSNQ